MSSLQVRTRPGQQFRGRIPCLLMGPSVETPPMLPFFPEAGRPFRQGPNLPASGPTHASRRNAVPYPTLHRYEGSL